MTFDSENMLDDIFTVSEQLYADMAGRLAVYLGFIIANLGIILLSSNPSFHSPLLRIAQLDVSDPLDAVVAMTPMLSTFSGTAPLEKKSHTSPS